MLKPSDWGRVSGSPESLLQLHTPSKKWLRLVSHCTYKKSLIRFLNQEYKFCDLKFEFFVVSYIKYDILWVKNF